MVWNSASSKPRFSIVIPVYKVQGYLRECLDSVLGQGFTDFEVIAVNDCSPDACGAILDEYAARDSRVMPVHLERNGGIGNARNVGVKLARGDYLLFLDSDDTLTAHALHSMQQRLVESRDPDLLFFDHVRTYWWDMAQPSATSHLLEQTGDEIFRPAERPDLFHLFAVVWNRLFRREFFISSDLTFTDGLYEDALVVYLAMLTADTGACLDRVCVEYRQRRQGNSMKTPGREHFTIFQQYQRLFDFLDAHRELDALRPVLFQRMASHFLFTLARTSRVVPADRREFFSRASAMYKAHVPAGFRVPSGLLGAKFRALHLGSYTAFRCAKTVNFTRVSARKAIRKNRRAVARRLQAAHYWIQRQLPIDEQLAVYSAYWSRGPACNPLAVYRAAQELAPEVHGVWVVRPDAVGDVPEGMDHVVLGSRRYWRVMARAKFCVNNVNFPDSVAKRPGQIHLMTHHGTPLKRMGVDQQRFPAAAKGMSFRRLLQRADRWDYSLSSNQLSTEHWERVYPCGFTSLDYGYPRNDVYYTSTAHDVARARERLGIAPGRTALLYAPTLRDYQAGYAPAMDLANVARALGPDFLLMVRTHYSYAQDPRLAELQQQGLLLDVSRHPSVEELCLAADALITDYSSIQFDFACLDRPIIIYAADWETYVRSRGVTFDLLSGKEGDTPGAVVTTEEELVALLRDGDWDTEQTTALRAAFRRRFCAYDDGHASERVVRRVLLGQEITPPAGGARLPMPAPQPVTAARPAVTGAAGPHREHTSPRPAAAGLHRGETSPHGEDADRRMVPQP
ncbi:bifunctional glycosyltransferase/CDP-glycerol:glycerophosphate glycerophosphotransferase [Streptomyces jeddahensis]|uniref:CDP-glycerol:poly(Glycerophosphate) glycerophosphotransferase n=1 Tax=Streptomyces jeddahensis TaxID=1716141 RepID=A0A177HPY1_9ACTN|nr:bifunctional glycosyltransferase family 2 protein/CDP-glycerol:glycerophosphate glycerophosphotransferase [Streptomyces jeddahensis]OAH13072.1 CDP-glycerol:poly(glycerophosphate) glycerophosphotransferase [Streptomyces jeddahensis]